MTAPNPWFTAPIGVPFGNKNFDVQLGASHDMTFLLPPNTPITAIAEGIISDISEPSWGKQVCIKLNTPVNGHDYFCLGLHLSATEPSLRLGQHVTFGQLIGWSGGCTSEDQYAGTSNPTGENFVDTLEMSSQPQVGIALHDGPSYGGIGWANFIQPDGSVLVDTTLDPEPVLEEALAKQKAAVTPPPVDYVAVQAQMVWEAAAKLLRICYNVEPAYGSIAYELWYKLYHEKKRNMGPPVTPEIKYVDWNGNPGTCIWFAGGDRIEIIDHVAKAYDAANVEIVP